MGDDLKETKPKAPDAEGSTGQSTSREATLEQARKFLQDAQVQNTTPERKAEFLKSKGLSESNIEALLKEVSQDSQASVCCHPPSPVSQRWFLTPHQGEEQ